MATLADIRAQHPEYNDLSDQQLADGLYRKFYSDMPRDQFDAKVGLSQPEQGSGGGQPVTDVLREMVLGKKPPADRGSLDAAARGIANSVPFIDEISGVLGGAADATLGAIDRATGLELGPAGSKGTFEGGYNRTVNNARGMDQAAAGYHPGWFYGSQVGGMLATAPLVPEVAIGRLAQGTGLAARAIRGAETAGLYSGVYGAGAADGDLGDRAMGALTGAGVGALTGGIAPIALAGLGAAGRAAVRPFRSAGSRVSGAIEADLRTNPNAVTDWGAAQGNGAPVIAADIGETTRALARSAANTSPEGRAILNQALEGRQAGQIDRAAQLIEQAAPGVNAPQTRELLQQAAARANQPAYARAYLEGEGGVWNEGLQQLTTADEVKRAIAAATRTGTNRAAVEGTRPPTNPFVRQQDGTLTLQPGMRPTLRFWDVVKQNLDSQIGMAQRAGDNPRVRDLTRLKTQLVSYLDEAVPSYRTARQGAAAFFGADNALEAGSNFVTQRADNFREAADALGRMNPAERQLFGEGFATTLISRLREANNRHSIINSIFVSSPAARERIGLALGQGAADRMEAFLRVENLMDLTRRSLQGNSTTVRQLAELGLATGAGVVSTGGNLSDPSTYIHAALVYGLLHGRRAAMQRIDTNIAREVARLLASDDPAVVRQAIDRIGRSPRLLNALRAGESRFSRVLAPLVTPKAGGDAGLLQGGAPGAAASPDENQ